MIQDSIVNIMLG